jgi:hypothetical protein
MVTESFKKNGETSTKKQNTTAMFLLSMALLIASVLLFSIIGYQLGLKGLNEHGYTEGNEHLEFRLGFHDVLVIETEGEIAKSQVSSTNPFRLTCKEETFTAVRMNMPLVIRQSKIPAVYAITDYLQSGPCQIGAIPNSDSIWFEITSPGFISVTSHRSNYHLGFGNWYTYLYVVCGAAIGLAVGAIALNVLTKKLL